MWMQKRSMVLLWLQKSWWLKRKLILTILHGVILIIISLLNSHFTVIFIVIVIMAERYIRFGCDEIVNTCSSSLNRPERGSLDVWKCKLGFLLLVHNRIFYFCCIILIKAWRVSLIISTFIMNWFKHIFKAIICFRITPAWSMRWFVISWYASVNTFIVTFWSSLTIRLQHWQLILIHTLMMFVIALPIPRACCLWCVIYIPVNLYQRHFRFMFLPYLWLV